MGNPFAGQLRLGPPGFAGRGEDTAVAILESVLGFAIWVLVLLVIAWGVREILRVVSVARRPSAPPLNPALTELDMRYARGEITRSDYLTRRADLGALPLGPVPPAG